MLVKKYMPPKYVESPDMSTWAECVGGLILNFGGAEFQTLRWIELLAGVDAAISFRTKFFVPRINAAKDLIDGSHLADKDKTLSHELWNEIIVLTKVRNQIAHNPLVLGREEDSGGLAWSVIDLNKVVPVGDNRLEKLDYLEIQRVALRVRDITLRLSSIIESVPE